MSRQPDGPPPPPTVQKLRVRYAKRGRLRFTSHRDFARAFERAIRRSGLPIAFSAGFNPHPKVSYAGAAPTGVASEAEYLEISLAEAREPDVVRSALDDALPPGLDILDVIDAAASESKSLAERIEASRWIITLPEVPPLTAQAALDALLAVATAVVLAAPGASALRASAPSVNAECATLDVVVQHATPAVRPDDILTALRTIGALTTPVTPVVTRLAQGLLDNTSPEDAKRLIDPLS
jgi:radical SAM-linked protein